MTENTIPAPESDSHPVPPTSADPGPERPAPPAESSETSAAAGETTEAFAELLAQNQGEPQAKLRRGEKVKAKVIRVTEEWIFVSLGGKEEGTIRISELAAAAGAEGDPGGSPAIPAEGDEIEAFILKAGGGELILSTKLSGRDASLGALEEAWRSGIPVEGRVAQSVKGGYEVRIAGLRAFCPLSHIDLRWPKEPAEHVGKTFSFKVLEFKEKGRNVIVSRRAILEEERSRKREELKQRLVPGAVVQGTVRSVQNFGAFVDLGGLDGLIPVSELAWGRVESPGEVLKEGQGVEAKVLGVDWERDRVSLSVKALQQDPWTTAAESFQPGQKVAGTVARLAPFGAFVTLGPGIDGLVHISALGAGRRVKHPSEVLQPGEQVEVEVVSVDPASRRISLSLEHRHLESMGDLPRANEVLGGTVEKVADFGVFVKLPSGHTGLVPNAEVGTPKGTAHAQMFKPGDRMEVLVLGVEEGGRRIRLSRKAVGREKEDEIVRDYSAAQTQGPASMGTFADLLKSKLKGR